MSERDQQLVGLPEGDEALSSTRCGDEGTSQTSALLIRLGKLGVQRRMLHELRQSDLSTLGAADAIMRLYYERCLRDAVEGIMIKLQLNKRAIQEHLGLHDRFPLGCQTLDQAAINGDTTAALLLGDLGQLILKAPTVQPLFQQMRTLVAAYVNMWGVPGEVTFVSRIYMPSGLIGVHQIHPMFHGHIWASTGRAHDPNL